MTTAIPYLTLDEACVALGVSRITLRRYLAADRLPRSFRFGRDWLIHRADVDELQSRDRRPGRRKKP